MIDLCKGHLQKEVLVINRPGFAKALGCGLNWLVLHWQTEYIFEGIADFAQSALNTTVQGQWTEIEVMLGMHRMASSAMVAGREVNWQSTEQAACSSLPQCAAWIKALTVYVKANSGGTEGNLLHELAMYHKSFGTSDKGLCGRWAASSFSRSAP